MKIDEIKTIVKLMSENDLTEFRIECEDMHLCLKRGSAQSAVIPQSVLSVPAPIPVSAPAATPAPAKEKEEAPAEASPIPADSSKIIESPIVGTFYRSASPGADPVVKVGSKVDPETVVCIIEAMKVMNEIKAERAGVVKEIVAQNGQPVEYGQVLMILE